MPRTSYFFEIPITDWDLPTHFQSLKLPALLLRRGCSSIESNREDGEMISPYSSNACVFSPDPPPSRPLTFKGAWGLPHSLTSRPPLWSEYKLTKRGGLPFRNAHPILLRVLHPYKFLSSLPTVEPLPLTSSNPSAFPVHSEPLRREGEWEMKMASPVALNNPGRPGATNCKKELGECPSALSVDGDWPWLKVKLFGEWMGKNEPVTSAAYFTRGVWPLMFNGICFRIVVRIQKSVHSDSEGTLFTD